jgi:hypothetical protein
MCLFLLDFGLGFIDPALLLASKLGTSEKVSALK